MLLLDVFFQPAAEFGYLLRGVAHEDGAHLVCQVLRRYGLPHAGCYPWRRNNISCVNCFAVQRYNFLGNYASFYVIITLLPFI